MRVTFINMFLLEDAAQYRALNIVRQEKLVVHGRFVTARNVVPIGVLCIQDDLLWSIITTAYITIIILQEIILYYPYPDRSHVHRSQLTWMSVRQYHTHFDCLLKHSL